MKKILLILVSIFINIVADSINPALNEAIRSSDLEKVREIMKKELMSEKEKAAYLDLAEEILFLRTTRIIDPSLDALLKPVGGNGQAQILGGGMFIFISIVSALLYQNSRDSYRAAIYNSADIDYHERMLKAIGTIALVPAYFLLKDGYGNFMAYKAKIDQLYRNAQEIKQLLLIS